MAQNSPDDMKIADQYTVADWKAMKSILVPGQPDNWESAFELFFGKRIETRYFEPIKLLQKHGDNKGEGFSIVALQCSLIEFLASTRTGKKYKYCRNKEKDCDDNEYCKSKEIFTDFLDGQSPFLNSYTKGKDGKSESIEFYENVRCALLHEARTTGNWKIHADCPENKNRIIYVDEKTGEKILYRNNLQKAFEIYVDNYGNELKESKKLQEAFIRKFDSLCEE